MPSDDDKSTHDLDQDQLDEATDHSDDESNEDLTQPQEVKGLKTLAEMRKKDRSKIEDLEATVQELKSLVKPEESQDEEQEEGDDETEIDPKLMKIVDKIVDKKMTDKEIKDRIGDNEELQKDYEELIADGVPEHRAIEFAENKNGVVYETSPQSSSVGTVDRSTKPTLTKAEKRDGVTIEMKEKYSGIVQEV